MVQRMYQGELLELRPNDDYLRPDDEPTMAEGFQDKLADMDSTELLDLRQDVEVMLLNINAVIAARGMR